MEISDTVLDDRGIVVMLTATASAVLAFRLDVIRVEHRACMLAECDGAETIEF